MSSFSLVISVLAIHLLAVVSPGPDFLIVIRNAISCGRRSGIWTAVGIGLSNSIHIALCLAGFAVLLSQSAVLFTTIKFLGAAYLIYIGVASIRSRTHGIALSTEADRERQPSSLRALRQGFLTSVLNPKPALFYIFLFATLLPTDTSFALTMIIASVMVVDATFWFILVACFFTHTPVRSVFSRFQNTLNRVFGGLLVLIGVKVALIER